MSCACSSRARRCRPTPTSSSCPAARRPSPTSPRCGGRAGTSTSRPMSAAAAGSVGLCGGFQMLGRTIDDPRRRRGCAGDVAGLGLLGGRHRPDRAKTLAVRDGRELGTGMPVRGYEIHMGRTDGPGRTRPMLDLAGGTDGAVAADGRVDGLLPARPVRERPLPSRLLARVADGRWAAQRTRPGSRPRSTEWRCNSSAGWISSGCWRSPGSRGSEGRGTPAGGCSYPFRARHGLRGRHRSGCSASPDRRRSGISALAPGTPTQSAERAT